MQRHLFVAFYLTLTANVFCADQINFFPEQTAFFSASALDFRHYLYTGSENGRVVNHGNFGVEFPVARFSNGNGKNCAAGIAAAAHLVLYTKNLKFAVDNLYATLAVYVEGKLSPKFSVRLYPVYHVSGHLADGSPDDSALIHARAVSSEMVKLEGTCLLSHGITASAGYGYYYHVCAQQGLTDRFDLALQWQPIPDKLISPYLTISGQVIYRRQWRSGFDMEAGTRFIGERGRGITLGLRYFNCVDPGYYFDRREKSAGVQIDFLL